MTDEAPVRRRGQTIRDVAEAAGVSIGTVSKALNKSGTLRQETRDRIARIATELGFRPNDLAQSLLRGQSFTVGLISDDSFGRFTLPIMEGLERELADRRIGIFMCNATDDPERERQHIEQLMGKRVDGLIFTARRADRRPGVSVPLGDLPDPLRLLARPRRRQPSASSPTTRRAPASPPRTSPQPAAAASPTSPAPSTSRPSASAATAGAPALAAAGLADAALPHRRLVRGLGPRGRRRPVRRPGTAPRRRLRRQRPDRPRPPRRPARPRPPRCPRTWRSSASTTGT